MRSLLEVFKLSSLGHVVIRIDAYRAQATLTQCGHVWTNCKQFPRCLWCREKCSEHSTPSCCNCTLEEEEKLIPQTIAAAGMRKRSRSAERCRKPPRRRIHSGESPLPSTEPHPFLSLQQSAETSNRSYLSGSSSHSLSRPS
jgi:hypothetical protein